MPKIVQLSTHVANLIAAGEVVERPASVVKELLENAVDAGASKITVEIRNGGMTFLRVTDDGCGMTPEDARTAFKRHATSKLRSEEDLAAISTMGFRGEALAAIASVSRVDLMTKTAGALSGVSLHLEAGVITEEEEVGCPEGTTIIIRDLFFNTPARMKFMKSDSVEGGRVSATVQLQALAHPGVALSFIRDGKQTLQAPGDGNLGAAVYSVYGREAARFVEVDSRWEGYHVTGFVSKPSDSRPSRSLQTFFVNGRPVRSRLLIQALEEAYRNQLMVGKFPACVLHLTLPANAVDVNVHPAKTEVKFLSEKAAFDCVHYGVLATLNKTPDRPQIQLNRQDPEPVSKSCAGIPEKKQDFFRTMTPEEYKTFSKTLTSASAPSPVAAKATLHAIQAEPVLHEPVVYPVSTPSMPVPPPKAPEKPEFLHRPVIVPVEEECFIQEPTPPIPLPDPEPVPAPAAVQEELNLPKEEPWRLVGELFRTYVVVEQGDNTFLIDKHAAHERILFDKFRQHPEAISSQSLLAPVTVRMNPDFSAVLLAKKELLDTLGFEIEEFGENTLLVRRIPMDLREDEVSDALLAMADSLTSGKGDGTEAIRDDLLHTVACKAAIKAGWITDEQELLALVREVMGREDLKYCPHGRPICTTLTKHQLERQFRRV